jgi:hypothetical protein
VREFRTDNWIFFCEYLKKPSVRFTNKLKLSIQRLEINGDNPRRGFDSN